MQASSSDIPKKQGTHHLHRAVSVDGNPSVRRSLHTREIIHIGGQQQQQRSPHDRFQTASLLAGEMARPNDSSMPYPQREIEHDPNAAIVLTPRVAGEEPSCRNQSLRSVSPTLIREILEKSGMALRVPNFLGRAATRESVRDVFKAKFKPRPCSPCSRRQPKIVRLKSSSPGLVTVPVSAKQWLLQALGLKDSEIYELFHQMESMPQFAAEYVREVKDEWQALESREMKKPPEVEYLSKDQALLEKVRGLILRYARAHEYEESTAKQQGSQIVKERDNNGKSLNMQGERNMCDFQDNGTLRPDQGILIREIDEGDAVYTTQSVMCSSCGQARLMSDADSQRPVPATNAGPREFSSQLRHVLPSFIPVDDYVVKQCVVQPELHGKVEHKSRFSPLDKRWYTVLFPALQPGRREDVQLLGEWLQHSMHRNCHENHDGQFEDAEAAFILHSIAFLEIVRQVDLQCEERGNLLLHVWRQILRVFNQVTKLLGSVYSSKIEADAVDDAANNERQSCSEFVYDFMLNLYGLKGIAESAIHGLFKTIKSLISSKQMDKHHKVRLFSKFVGVEGESFREVDLYLYLKLLQKGMGKACAILPSDQDDGLIFLNFSYIEYILDEPTLIQFMGSEAAARDVIMKFATKYLITEKASPEIKKLVKENEVKKLDWDHLVETILESRPRTQVEEKRQSVRKSVHEKPPLTEEKLQELVNLFTAGDANQDGVLTFTEFREIISTAEPSISTQSALRMFRETLLLMPDGGDSISPQAFATIAHDHGISAPSSVVFDLLKKTWSQVQSDVNEDKMQEASQKREFESLRSTLLSMLADQKNVTEAVAVFRNLVLKFCGGEEEGEDADHDNAESEAGDID